VNIIVISLFFVAISFVFSMLGLGGGLVYVPLLVIIGFSMKEASMLSLFAIFMTTLMASINFIRSKRVDWSLFAIMEPTTAITAFIGGFFAIKFGEHALRLLLVCALVVAGVITLFSGKKAKAVKLTQLCIRRKVGGAEYLVDLPIVAGLSGLVGFIAGMIGIAGGVFKVPIMVAICAVPMDVAVATSAAMVATTAAFGLSGHLASTPHVNLLFILIFGVACLIGGFLGSKCALKVRRELLRKFYFLLMISLALWVSLTSYIL